LLLTLTSAHAANLTFARELLESQLCGSANTVNLASEGRRISQPPVSLPVIVDLRAPSEINFSTSAARIARLGL
jgi:hypothetical protein